MATKKVTLAIIGTAGRGDDSRRLAKDPYHYLTNMYRAARKVIELTGANTLISGGAAWADHCAVTIFLRDQIDDGEEHLKLELHLPTTFFPHKNPRYEENPNPDAAKFDSGRISNHYHREFTEMSAGCFPDGWASLDELAEAIKHPYCIHNAGGGFKSRNRDVAQADHVLAMTFGTGKMLKDGGTAHTMSEFLKRQSPFNPGVTDMGQSYHLDLNTCCLFKGATVDPEALKHPFKKTAVIPRAILDKFNTDSPF